MQFTERELDYAKVFGDNHREPAETTLLQWFKMGLSCQSLKATQPWLIELRDLVGERNAHAFALGHSISRKGGMPIT